MSVFDEIKSRISLASYLGISPRDKMICCPLPWHNDSSPSCSVDHSTNRWYCFACAQGGDIFHLAEAQENVDRGTALRILAEKAGVSLDPQDQEAAQREGERRARINAARHFAAKYYHDAGMANPAFIHRWVHQRGISQQALVDMKIGFADGKLWHEAEKILSGPLPLTVGGKPLKLQDFQDAGLLVWDEKKQALRDWFDFRDIFPCYVNGKVANMTGRATENSFSINQKYKHLQGEEISYLYNEGALQGHGIAWVFEGHPDALTGVSLGLPAVGIIGTGGLTCPERLAGLKKIYLCPDNDDPGRRAALNWYSKIVGVNPKAEILFVQLPSEFKDFNDWARANIGQNLQTAAAALQAAAVPVVAWKIQQTTQSSQLNDLWPLFRGLSYAEEDQLLKQLYVNLGKTITVTALRKTLRGWQETHQTIELKDEYDYATEPYVRIAQHWEIRDKEAVGHFCIFARQRMVNEAGEEGFTDPQPLLIRSTAKGKALTIERVRLEESGFAFDPKDVPNHEEIQGRWSPDSIKQTLSGRPYRVNTATLVSRLSALFRAFVWYDDPGVYDVFALYAMATYLAGGVPAFPYLALNGEAETGKSTTLELFGDLCFNSCYTASVSTASLFRLTHSGFATLILDEAEQYGNTKDPDEQMAEKQSILKSGYKADGRVKRMEPAGKDRRLEVSSYRVYGPKIFAGIRDLDDVLKTRTIPIECRRAPDDVLGAMSRKVQAMGKLSDECAALRDELYVWALTKFHELLPRYQTLDLPGSIQGRNWEVWAPLFMVAAQADAEEKRNLLPEETWLSKLGRFAVRNTAKKKAEQMEASRPLNILEAVYRCVVPANMNALAALQPLPGKPNFYDSRALAKQVSEYLFDVGYYNKKVDLGPRTVRNALAGLGLETSPPNQMDTKVRFEGNRVRVLYIDKNQLTDMVMRLLPVVMEV